MHRNYLKNQYESALNPDAVYQLPFRPPQTQKTITYPVKNNNAKKRKFNKSVQKKKYLSLVSSDQKLMNTSRAKSNKNKRLFVRKANSVILGGQKKSFSSSINTQNSQRSSLCQTTHFSLPEQKINNAPIEHKQIHPVQYISHPVIPFNKVSYIISEPYNLQLKTIVHNKLNLAAVQPHTKIYNSIFNNRMFNSNPQSLNKQSQPNSFGKGIVPHRRNMSTGRIYSTTVTGPKSQNQFNKIVQNKQTNQRINNFITPKFEKPLESNRQHEINKPKSPQNNKKRRNAGFIRSTSAKKFQQRQKQDSTNKILQISIPQKLQTFRYTTQNQRALIHQGNNNFNVPYTSGKIQLDICFDKMTSLKKQIKDLQAFLENRYKVAQMRSKSLNHCSSAQSLQKAASYNNSKGLQSFISSSFKVYEPIVSPSQLKFKLNNNKNKSNNNLQNSQYSTIVNRLNSVKNSSLSLASGISCEFNKYLPKDNQNSNELHKNIKMASSIYSSNQLNTMNKTDKIQNRKTQQEKVLTNYNRQNNNFIRPAQYLSVEELCKLKCPSNNIENQIIKRIVEKSEHKNDKTRLAQTCNFVNKNLINQENVLERTKIIYANQPKFNEKANNSKQAMFYSTSSSQNFYYNQNLRQNLQQNLKRQFGGPVNYLR